MPIQPGYVVRTAVPETLAAADPEPDGAGATPDGAPATPDGADARPEGADAKPVAGSQADEPGRAREALVSLHTGAPMATRGQQDGIPAVVRRS